MKETLPQASSCGLLSRHSRRYHNFQSKRRLQETSQLQKTGAEPWRSETHRAWEAAFRRVTTKVSWAAVPLPAAPFALRAHDLLSSLAVSSNSATWIRWFRWDRGGIVQAPLWYEVGQQADCCQILISCGNDSMLHIARHVRYGEASPLSNLHMGRDEEALRSASDISAPHHVPPKVVDAHDPNPPALPRVRPSLCRTRRGTHMTCFATTAIIKTAGVL